MHPPGAAHRVLWNALRVGEGDPNDLGSSSLGVPWTVVIETGGWDPRVVFARGRDATIVRATSPDRVMIQATPVPMSDNPAEPGCNPIWPWTCPETAENDRTILSGEITDFGQWTDVAQRNSIRGMNYATKVELTSMPPEIVPDATTGEQQLLIRLADGSTLFEGFAHLRIPNAFLRTTYGIDDPASLSGTGLVTTGPGPGATVRIAQEDTGSAMLVDLEGLTFSRRTVRVRRGVITPTRPRNVRARRATATRGVLRFTAARSRGARFTGYQARCLRAASVVRATSSGSPIKVTGLRPGLRYACRVRAGSRAGFGPFSPQVRMPARP